MNTFKHFIKSFLGISFLFVFMFAAAGRSNYREGIIYYAISIIGLLANIATSNNELISERSKPGANTQSWDKKY